jgi:HAD superfamily hydrolase (TIGR01509 family)
MGKPVELVIFDCDGVLVDSETIGVVVDQRVLADLGWNLTIDEVVERFVGGTKENFESQIEAFLRRPLEAGWHDSYASWYQEAFDDELRTVAGIEMALEKLRIPSCVASNSSHARIRNSLVVTGLLPYFDGRIFSAEEVEHGKPDPDIFLWAAKRMGVEPANCLVVEDSRFGVLAARAAGMRVLGYAGGLTPPSSLEGVGATVFSSMDELEILIPEW